MIVYQCIFLMPTRKFRAIVNLIWLHYDLQINQKAAESLADPEEYANMFEEWQIALAVETKAAETR